MTGVVIYYVIAIITSINLDYFSKSINFLIYNLICVGGKCLFSSFSYINNQILTSLDTCDVLYVAAIYSDLHVSVVLVHVCREVKCGGVQLGNGAFVRLGGAPRLTQRTAITVVVPTNDTPRTTL